MVETATGGLAAETARRRTFAIISHPDAGKTTLTEKLLLYSGMLRTAGMVQKAKNGRLAASDWMAMEQDRGISVTASAMQFPYRGRVVNVLDTPGHEDFADDTFRTLTAADCAIMVLDSAKGVEAQTRRLFEACRRRGTPVITFVNKMDAEGRHPLDLMAEVEEVLGIGTYAWNWPIGGGREFTGVIDRAEQQLVQFEKAAAGGAQAAILKRSDLSNLDEVVGADRASELRDELELLDVAGDGFDHEAFLNAEVSPVFFGSALTNFGVEPLFDSFVDLAPAPGPRSVTALGDGSSSEWDPVAAPMSGYVFKIQANMDPRHRDSLAFVRICSGSLTRDQQVLQVRAGEVIRDLRLSRAATMVAKDRTTVDQACPGDVVGLVNSGFALGDTIIDASVARHDAIEHAPLPLFSPRVFARVVLSDTGRRKAFDKGIDQLATEGSALLLRPYGRSGEAPIVAALGRLQLEVLQSRLATEYQCEVDLTPLPFACSGWLDGDIDAFEPTTTALVATDARQRAVALFTSEWDRDYCLQQNPDHQLREHA